MGLMFWPIVWIAFMVGVSGAFGFVMMKESQARAKAAKEMAASQQAMAAAGAEMAPPGGDPGFNDGFGDAGEAEFAEFDENAFK